MNKITICGVRCWNFSCTGRLVNVWKKLRTKSQQQEWHLHVILRLIYCAKNETATSKVHIGGKMEESLLTAISGSPCQVLQAICAGGCLVAGAKVQGCHLLRDSLHVQVFGMAPDVSTGIQVVGSSESDTEVVSDPCSVYESPHFPAASPIFDTPVFATPSPESCPLIDTPVLSSSSPDVSIIPTTPSQEPHTTISYSRGQRLEELVSLSSTTSEELVSSCVSRASSPATTISYEDDLSPVTLPLCVQWYVRGLASGAAWSAARE